MRSVAQLLGELADLVQLGFSACSVRGELSSLSRASSGHLYFNLKDADGGNALIRCAMFRRAASMLPFMPGDGQLVELRGRLTVYEPRGDLQFVVQGMRQAGEGALYEQFLRTKARLEAEGLFDASSKRELRRFPSTLGVVTSLAGAALHDVLSTVARRAPHLSVIVYPSLVQGAGAAMALASAIDLASSRAEVDVLLVCRGGGSLEDLWSFNDERVVRAIRRASMPVIAGVGHDTDVTLTDFAADLRAPTPTAAAELAVPTQAQCWAQLVESAELMHRRVSQVIDVALQRLNRIAMRLSRPDRGVQHHAQHLASLAHRLATHWPQTKQSQRARLTQWQDELRFRIQARRIRDQQRLGSLKFRLEALDPSRVLARGYAWLSNGEGQAVTTALQITSGDRLHAVLRDGQADVLVTDVQSRPVD